MIDLSNKRVLITGPNSMIGENVQRALAKRNNVQVYKTLHNQVDLLDQQATSNWFFHVQPDYVIHLATYSGNVQFNQKYPADTFYRTSQIGLNVLKACQDYHVKKVVSVMSSCAIADLGEKVLEETDLWKGLPNHSIESHGFAKRILDAYSRQLSKQYDIDAVTCILNNSYGPGDSLDLDKCKVVGSLIKKFVDARRSEAQAVSCWGSGRPLREFIYCKDAAEGIVQTLERYNDPTLPLNITSDEEVSIRELTEMIAELTSYKGQITWDTSKTDGQMRKKLSSKRMHEYLSVPITPIKQALKETIEWYEQIY
jgi:GDP-L-fucose synthase